MRQSVRHLMPLLLAAAALAQPESPRPLDFTAENGWRGAGICYGEYRDDQSPDAAPPADHELREDLHILAERWSLIRMYGTRNAERVCEIIREDDLPLRLMVGAWLTTEDSVQATSANRSEVETAITLANAYPDVVFAINVGNETQVSWSGHRLEQGTLLAYLGQVREATAVAVTTCDDFSFWRTPESEPVARACDFIGLHAHPMWNGQTLRDALSWTREQIRAVEQAHPDTPVLHCETGWATKVHTEGEQARLIKGAAGEPEQELFYRAYRSWATEAGLPHFYFQACDERWKGGGHPDEVEKHWGLFNADRTPKQAVREPTE